MYVSKFALYQNISVFSGFTYIEFLDVFRQETVDTQMRQAGI